MSNRERLPNEEEWQAWLSHPVTELFREWARLRQQALYTSWASGAFSHPDDVKSLAANHAAIGGHSVYQEVLEMDFQFILGEFDDGEHERAGAGGPGSADKAL